MLPLPLPLQVPLMWCISPDPYESCKDFDPTEVAGGVNDCQKSSPPVTRKVTPVGGSLSDKLKYKLWNGKTSCGSCKADSDKVTR